MTVMRLRVHRHPDATSFLRRAEPWLLQAEAEYNLILGIARALITTPTSNPYVPPIYLATIEVDDVVAGCAYRTPPFKFGLTRMPEAAVDALVDDVASVYPSLPAALGPEAETRAFAERWCRRKGGVPRLARRSRIYQLDSVTPPAEIATDRLRVADESDTPLIKQWLDEFRADTQIDNPGSEETASRWIRGRNAFLWEDDGPVSMAAVVGRSPNGARIGGVYTPAHLRRRGYASSCVAALSQVLLDSGRRYCFLYTDLANPTSNAIYTRIGYRPVADVIDIHLQ
jgi:predicted GNAT family acetyltransferase